jgi:hypothetical protein
VATPPAIPMNPNTEPWIVKVGGTRPIVTLWPNAGGENISIKEYYRLIASALRLCTYQMDAGLYNLEDEEEAYLHRIGGKDELWVHLFGTSLVLAAVADQRGDPVDAGCRLLLKRGFVLAGITAGRAWWRQPNRM